MKYIIALALIAVPLGAMEIPMESQSVKIPSDKVKTAKKIMRQAGMEEKDNTLKAIVEAFTLMEKDPQLPANTEAQPKIGINSVKLAWHSLHTAQSAAHVAKKAQRAWPLDTKAAVPAQPANLIQESSTFIKEVLDLCLGNKISAQKKQLIYTALSLGGGIVATATTFFATYFGASGQGTVNCNCTGI